MRKLLVLIFLMLAGSGFGKSWYKNWWDNFSNWCNSKESGVGLAWLKLAPSARGISLGNAGVSSDPTALWWNPAGLAMSKGLQVNFTHTQHFLGLRNEFFGVSKKMGTQAFGLSLSGIFADGFELRNERQDLLGEFGVHNFMVSVGYARNLSKDFNLGLTAKMIYERIYVYDFKSWLLDFGFSYTPYPDLWLTGTIVNLGPKPKFEKEYIKPPRAWRIGANYEIKKFLFSISLNKYIDAILRGGMGIEYELNPYLSLRGGYKIRYDTETLSLGFGIKYKGFTIDYAFRPYTLKLGSSHIFTITR
ncbi:PorV/PorQ family protein [candidate division WOR-3 bacterium]|nr:PorV/PorQ family protein [candidate division WOR-3 bacterium]